MLNEIIDLARDIMKALCNVDLSPEERRSIIMDCAKGIEDLAENAIEK